MPLNGGVFEQHVRRIRGTIVQQGTGSIDLVALSRLPNEQEKQKLTAYLSKDKQARAQGVRDMVWAVLNTKEFLFIR